MELKILTEEEKAFYRDDIFDTLKENDKEFVPPLSTRNSTTQSNFNFTGSGNEAISSYANEMLSQVILGAFDENTLVGFVSFKENYISDVISSDSMPNIYISTLLLKKEARGRRLTSQMYDFLFNTLYSERNIFTRTWSTNLSHLKILDNFGFTLIKTIKNDRGNGIDTVYFALKR